VSSAAPGSTSSPPRPANAIPLPCPDYLPYNKADSSIIYCPPRHVVYWKDDGDAVLFLRPGAHPDELWFILGWAQTNLATTLLKKVVNHTRNVQSKDVERLPYPWWVDPETKSEVILRVKLMVTEAREGRVFETSDPEVHELNRLFAAKPPDSKAARHAPLPAPARATARPDAASSGVGPGGPIW